MNPPFRRQSPLVALLLLLVLAAPALALPTLPQIQAGGSHSGFLKPDGSHWAWGSNGNGQLGDGGTTLLADPTRIGDDIDWVKILKGGQFTIGLKGDGTLWAWGRNYEGQLGDGTNTLRLQPVQTGDVTGEGDPDAVWADFAVGEEHVVALHQDGSLWGWGYNLSGQVGDGTTVNRNQPVPVADADAGNPWTSLAAAGQSSFALKQDGSLFAWGYNYLGQLGDGTDENNRLAPVPTTAGHLWEKVVAGFNFTFGIEKTTGDLYAWGHNNVGQLGDGGTSDPNAAAPVLVKSGTVWTDLAAGGFHAAAIDDGGGLWVWGSNQHGQLGDGNGGLNVYNSVPVQWSADTDWSRVAAGSAHTVALKSGGALLTWGSNANGQLGIGTTSIGEDAPQPAFADVTDVTPTLVTLDPVTTPTNLSSQTLTGSVSETGTKVMVTVTDKDGIEYVPQVEATVVGTSWSYELTGLREGKNAIQVDAQDAGLNWSEAVTSGITLDTQAPTVSLNALNEFVTSDTLPIGGSFADNVAPATVQIVVSPAGDAGGVTYAAGTWSATLTGFPEGTVTVSVTGTDAAGNVSSPATTDTFTYDATPPSAPSFTGGSTPTTDPRPTWSWNSGGGGNGTFRYELDDSDLATGATETSGTTFTPVVDLLDGPHTLYLQERDAVGNWSASSSYTIEVDTTAPEVAILSPGPGLTADTTPPLSFTVSEGTTTVLLNGSAIAKSSGETLDPLENGIYTLRVEAIDGAGNLNADEVTFTVDVDGPSLALISPEEGATNDSTPLVSYETDASTVVVEIQGGIYATWTELEVGSDEEIAPALADGAYQLRVTATDALDRSVSQQVAFRVDTVVPTVSIVEPADGMSYSESPFADYAASDDADPAPAVATFLDGAPYGAPFPSGEQIKNLPDGEHTFKVVVSDDAGNVQSAEAVFIIDTTNPAVLIFSPEPARIADATPLLDFSVDDFSEVEITLTLDGERIDKSPGESLDELSDGQHKLEIDVRDELGNVAQAHVEFIVDTRAEFAPDVNPFTTSRTQAIVVGSREAGLVLSAFSADGATLLPVDYPDDLSWRLPVEDLGIGLNRVTLAGTDDLGNSAEVDLEILVSPLLRGMVSATGTDQPVAFDLPEGTPAPVILAGIPVESGGDPGVVRIGGVSAEGFTARFQEWPYLDGSHGTEQVPWLGLLAGRYAMADGTLVEAGTFDLEGTDDFQGQAFAAAFPGKPTLLLTVQTENDGEPVAVVARNVTAEGFEAAFRHQELNRDMEHLEETVGYLAVYAPRSSGLLDFPGGEEVPFLVQEVAAGSKPAPVLSSSVRLEEEQSLDDEVDHAAEDVSLLVLDGSWFGQQVSAVEADAASLRRRSPAPGSRLEWGVVTIPGDRPVTVPLSHAYLDPVVILQPISADNPDPSLVQVLEVGEDDFTAAYFAWEEQEPGVDPSPVTAFYLVAEAGISEVAGLQVRAGRITAGTALDSWQRVPLGSGFSETPALFAALQGTGEAVAAVAQVQGVTTAGFEIRRQLAAGTTAPARAESLGWVAVEPGRGNLEGGGSLLVFTTTISGTPRTVDFAAPYTTNLVGSLVSERFSRRFRNLTSSLGEQSFAFTCHLETPVLVVGQQSAFDPDPAFPFFEGLTQEETRLWLREEGGGDHAQEDVGIFLAR